MGYKLEKYVGVRLCRVNEFRFYVVGNREVFKVFKEINDNIRGFFNCIKQLNGNDLY